MKTLHLARIVIPQKTTLTRVYQGKAPPQAISQSPAKGVRFRCNFCGASWPAFTDRNGNLCPSNGCDDGGCPACRVEITTFDPEKPETKPKLKPGEYAVEFQLKARIYAKETEAEKINRYNAFNASLMSKQVPVGAIIRPGGDLFDDYRLHIEGYDLLPSQGHVVHDYKSLTRVAYALKYNAADSNRPRAWLRVTDHEGAHLKFEELEAIFPAPKEPTVFEEDPERKPLPVDLKRSILRTLAELAGLDADRLTYADDGLSVAIAPTDAQLEAFERRREALRRQASPTDVVTLWHGSCAHNMPDILREGLRLSRMGSNKALGPGIYLGLIPKARAFAHGCSPEHFVPNHPSITTGFGKYTITTNIFDDEFEDGSGRKKKSKPVKPPCYLTRVQRRRFANLRRLHFAVECDVLLGRPYVVEAGDVRVPGDEGPRRALGRGDSIYCTRFKQDEWCVFRRDQVLIRKLVILGEDT